MMNYPLFKEQVAEHFGEYVPENFSDYRVEIYTDTRQKTAESKLALIPPHEQKLQVIPTISLQQMYEDYKQNHDFEKTISEAIGRIEKAYQSVFENRQESQVGITYERKTVR